MEVRGWPVGFGHLSTKGVLGSGHQVLSCHTALFALNEPSFIVHAGVDLPAVFFCISLLSISVCHSTRLWNLYFYPALGIRNSQVQPPEFGRLS